MGMAFPMWISGAVGSSPNFTLSGLFSFTDLLSFFVNSAFVTISTVPRRIISNCSSTSLNIAPPWYFSFADINYFLLRHKQYKVNREKICDFRLRRELSRTIYDLGSEAPTVSHKFASRHPTGRSTLTSSPVKNKSD